MWSCTFGFPSSPMRAEDISRRVLWHSCQDLGGAYTILYSCRRHRTILYILWMRGKDKFGPLPLVAANALLATSRTSRAYRNMDIHFGDRYRIRTAYSASMYREAWELSRSCIYCYINDYQILSLNRIPLTLTFCNPFSLTTLLFQNLITYATF